MAPLNSAGGLAMGLDDWLTVLRRRLPLLLGFPLLAGCIALGVSFFITPTFTAVTTFLPPQQPQSAVASALSSLGPLAGLAGAGGAARNSGDQFISLMQSATVADRIVERFGLLAAYKAELKTDARRELESRVRMSLGKKDGVITVEVDDSDPKRAAEIANSFVLELRSMTSSLAVTEAQQRRQFFGNQLERTRDQLARAQQALTSSGFSAGTLRAEPKAAAELYGRLRAEATAAEAQLQALRRSLADSTPEVQRAMALLAALRGQLAQAEASEAASGGPDYIGRYREFKYQETLFELFARQYELARVDEAKEGSLIQVIDAATPPERKSKPKRSWIALGAALGSGLLVLTWVLVTGPTTLRNSETRQMPREVKA